LLRACKTTTSRSLYAMLPTAEIVLDSDPVTAFAVRTPRFCWRRGLIATAPASLASSA
jgi:hypothetical protein